MVGETGKSGDYDVFLSHRGPDTKRGFTAHLHKGLKDAGLKPYCDWKDIDKGDDSWESIERAIKSTPLALVVFSENFAGSKWCLNELHLMLETPSIRVLPIFYKVEPEEVAEKLITAGLKELEKQRCTKEDIEMWRKDLDKAVEIWRKDLETAAGRGGWVYERNDRRNEPEFLEPIVQEIYDLGNKALTAGGVGEEDLVGVGRVAELIIHELDGKKVVMLGLWGVGGIGKSTLAWEVYSQLRKRESYSASCCVKDVSEKVRQIDGVEKVQGDILKGLCKGVDGAKIENKIDGKKVLEGRLGKSRYVLLLDDVSHEKDMMKYIISPTMLEGGSMCIVTTRDWDVLKEFQIGLGERLHVYGMCTLRNEDSKEVFTSYAFGGDYKVEPKFEALVDGISKACGGVPLVLKVIGSCLKGENDVNAWEEMKQSLEVGDVLMDREEIFNPLRRSYDTLSPVQKEMFLDIACGLIGQSMDFARRVWKSSKWCPSINIPILVRRALVIVDDEGRLRMHDVLRDMGRSIENEKNIGERRRMWMPESLEKFKEEALPKHLQSLVIDCSYKEALDVSDMKELRILLCGEAVDVTSIPTNLRWFVYGNLLRRFPRIHPHNKLVVLEAPFFEGCKCRFNVDHLPNCGWHGLFFGMCQCRFEVDHQPDCSLQGLGGLTALECLHLGRDSGTLNCLGTLTPLDIGVRLPKRLPDLQLLTKLEELVISCLDIEAVPGLDHLSALVKFDAQTCWNLVGLPDIGNLTRLQVLRLGVTTETILGLSKIMLNVTELRVSVEGLETPDVLNATKLLALEVWGWREGGPRAGINSMTLKSLSIWWGHCKILDGLLGMKNLESICLDGCDFEDVSCLNHLTTLKIIRIVRCCNLRRLPDLLELSRLETLDIRYCPELREWTLLSRSSSSGTALPSLQTLRFGLVPIIELRDKLKSMFPQFTCVRNLYGGEVWKQLSVKAEAVL